jgi:hypothetical protein
MTPLAIFGLDGIETLTLALVGITFYYAIQTRAMVKEMARAREQGIRPRLAVDIRYIGPGHGEVRLSNIGQGAASNVDVELRFEPAPAANLPAERRRWVAARILPGEHQYFAPPGELNMHDFAARYQRVVLSGTLEDSSGKLHPVEASTPSLRELWERAQRAQQRWAQDPAEAAIQELPELRRRLRSLTEDLTEIRRVATGERRLMQRRSRRLRRRTRLKGMAGRLRARG